MFYDKKKIQEAYEKATNDSNIYDRDKFREKGKEMYKNRRTQYTQ